MLTLRLTQHSSAQPNHYHVEIALDGNASPRRTATVPFAFALTVQEQEDLQWYFEDYLQNPHDPAPTIAARIERDMAEVGAALFRAVFHASNDARELWATLRDRLHETRVEVITGVLEAAAIPWELMRDPQIDAPLPLRARAFVRAHPRPAQGPSPSPTASGPVRILLIICRPGRRDDVPFRSVASRLIKGLGHAVREAFVLDVLRPPTFEQLGHTLRTAKNNGQPYHVVHFDGHGAFLDMYKFFERWKAKPEDDIFKLFKEFVHFDRDPLSPEVIYPHSPRQGNRGYLAFENLMSEHNLRLVDGPELGRLLRETEVPILVLNACRSAHADAPASPLPAAEVPSGRAERDPHAQVRALGSLAQEVMDAGAVGVVAMRYNVYVVTAAQFVADLYAALRQGDTLGEAVTLGRKQLAAQPLREMAYAPRPLHDWAVPVVYEAAPVALFPRPAESQKFTITLRATDTTPARESLDPELLKHQPEPGFFGRDETLLALDRAFDTQQIVLLHGYAGSGKTAAAAEFARWYALTGGLKGPVLFTSFEHPRSLPRALDLLDQVFGGTLDRAGIDWLVLSDTQRREVALQLLQQIPVLWVWDNVEPVAGFPPGTPSLLSQEEQRELVEFLRAARETGTKFLLTSRRDERAWLGELPARITIPPMPMLERIQLSRALAEKYGRQISDVDDWHPLLEFTQGNPLTITVVVGQALGDGLGTGEQIQAFVARLRAGEDAFEDEASEGRPKSLGASLSYGFEHAFNDTERQQLALLHLFQGVVAVDSLCAMGVPEEDWCLPAVRGLTREAGAALLNRAAEVGLLTAHGFGIYSMHAALPWFFKNLFDQHYLASHLSEEETPRVRAVRAFVNVTSGFARFCCKVYRAETHFIAMVLDTQEANLLYARQLARSHGWWQLVIETMEGLHTLYDNTGRRAEWKRLVEEIVPDFVDTATDWPLPGRETEWTVITGYRIMLTREEHRLPEAERLARASVSWNRQRAADALATSAEALDSHQRHAIDTLAVSLQQLGEILREQEKSECAELHGEVMRLLQRTRNRGIEATAAFNLGHAHLYIPALRDFAKAEHWYRRSLELRDAHEDLGQARCHAQLGAVAFQRFEEARAAKRPQEVVVRHLNAVAQSYLQALELLPSEAVRDLAAVHNELGEVYRNMGDLHHALSHYRKAIQYAEMHGNLYGAGETRFNAALALVEGGRLSDAQLYAQAALHNYEAYGEREAYQIRTTRELIGMIEQALKTPGG